MPVSVAKLIDNLQQKNDVKKASVAARKLVPHALQGDTLVIKAFENYVLCEFSKVAQMLAIDTLVSLARPNSTDFEQHFLNGLQFENTSFLAVDGLLKTIGRPAYPIIVTHILKCKEEPKNLASLITQLARHANQDFIRDMPLSAHDWTEENLPLAKIMAWQDANYPKGQGVAPPKISSHLTSPKTDIELALKSFDQKLERLRNLDPNFPIRPINLLVEGDMHKIAELQEKYNLPQYYVDFLSYASPFNLLCRITSPKGYNSVNLYSSDNLEQEQDWFFSSDVDIKTGYLHIGHTSEDPMCAIALKLSPLKEIDFVVYGCNSEDLPLMYKRLNKSFLAFIKSLKVKDG